MTMMRLSKTVRVSMINRLENKFFRVRRLISFFQTGHRRNSVGDNN